MGKLPTIPLCQQPGWMPLERHQLRQGSRHLHYLRSLNRKRRGPFTKFVNCKRWRWNIAIVGGETRQASLKYHCKPPTLSSFLARFTASSFPFASETLWFSLNCFIDDEFQIFLTVRYFFKNAPLSSRLWLSVATKSNSWSDTHIAISVWCRLEKHGIILTKSLPFLLLFWGETPSQKRRHFFEKICGRDR